MEEGNQKLRCLNCGSVHREKECELKGAGVTQEGQFWNTKCPTCGVYDLINERYAEMDEDEFRDAQEQRARDLKKHIG